MLKVAGTGARPWLGGRLEVSPLHLVGLVLTLFLYVAVKLEALGLSATDENIYFYGVKLVLEGKLPYRDFFFAHPPLHLLLPALLSLPFGLHLTLLKVLPLLASVVSGLAIWDTGRKTSNALAALGGMIFFLFAMEQLQASSNLTGINLTVMFMALGLRFFAVWHLLTAGLFCGLALATGLYSAALVPVLLLFAFRRGAREAGRFLAGVGLGVLPFFGFFYFLAPEAFLQGVFGYHFLKPVKNPGFFAAEKRDWLCYALCYVEAILLFCLTAPLVRRPSTSRLYLKVFALAVAVLAVLAGVASTSGARPMSLVLPFENAWALVKGGVFQRIAYYHMPLAITAGVLPLCMLLRRLLGGGQEGRRVLAQPDFEIGTLFIFLLLAVFFQFAFLNETHTFYYVLLIFPAALAAGRALAELLSSLLLAAGVVGGRGTRLRAGFGFAAVIAVLGLCAFGWKPAAAAIGKLRFPQEASEVGKKKCYPWKDSFASPFSPLVKRLFWEDCRVLGQLDPPIARYLWNKKNWFETAPEIAAWVRDNSRPEDTIAGASSVAPLIALLSGRRLAADEIDTNSKRITSGILKRSELWRRLCSDHLRYIVAAPRSLFTPDAMSRDPVARRNFKPARVFFDESLQHGGRFPVVLFSRDEASDGPCMLTE